MSEAVPFWAGYPSKSI